MQISSRLQQVRVYAVTTSYFKPKQLIYRVRTLFYFKFLHQFGWYRSRYEKLATGDEPYQPIEFAFVRPAATDLAALAEGTFTFLNRSVNLGVPTDWKPAAQTQLWLYNLYYFDYVRDIARQYQRSENDTSYQLFRRLAMEWMGDCPVATTAAWNPYPIALRVNNWLRAYTVFRPALELDTKFAADLRRSMYIQGVFLEKHLEYQLLNNHLLENGRTLWLLGHFFQGERAGRWRTLGYTILWRGLDENFLKDGGHDELSPMYHQIMLDMYQEVVDVMQSRNETVPAHLTDRLSGMRNWLATVLHPDGQVSLFNDAAMGIAGEPADFIGDAAVQSSGLAVLEDSGYFVFRDVSKGHFLMFDCGLMGPDHRLGHGHCDALSFELSIHGKRVIVDAGVSDYYGDLEWRDYYRSTRAHNTIVIDGAEQSEIWDRFRVARRARPRDVIWSENDTLAYVSAAHTGYQRLNEQVIHRRWVCWVDRRFWLICDRLEGHGTHVAESLLHFHPDISIIRAPEFSSGAENATTSRTALQQPALPGQVSCGDLNLSVQPWGFDEIKSYRGEHAPLQGWHSPEFGLDMENTVWGFTKELKLPAFSGYLLWPEKSKAVLNINKSGDTCEVEISARDRSYILDINNSGVSLRT